MLCLRFLDVALAMFGCCSGDLWMLLMDLAERVAAQHGQATNQQQCKLLLRKRLRPLRFSPYDSGSGRIGLLFTRKNEHLVEGFLENIVVVRVLGQSHDAVDRLNSLFDQFRLTR